jgi:TPR repeat protein
MNSLWSVARFAACSAALLLTLSVAALVPLRAFYQEKKATAQKPAESFNALRRAAEQGEAAAQDHLGHLYARGEETPQDYVQGYLWIYLGASHSSGDARRKFASGRDRLAREMTTQQVAEAQRLAREWKPKPTGPPAEDR